MFEFKLPDVGEGVAEGEILEWYVDVGDEVEEDQELAAVETDKAVVDVPSPVAGTVVERHAAVGEILAVGETLITIDDGSGEEPAVAASEETGAAATTTEPGVGDDGTSANARAVAPPSVRRLARELEVALADVRPTSESGRVTREDVRRAAESGDEDGEAEPTPASASPTDERESDSRATTQTTSTAPPTDGASATGSGAEQEAAARDRTLAVPATRALAEELAVDIDAVPTEETRDGEAFVTGAAVREFAEAEAEVADPAEATGAAETRVPYRGVRRTIGQKMTEAAFTAPHVTHHDRVEVSSLVAAREGLAERAAAADVRLTYLPFVLKAVVAGLEEYPILNSELDEEAEEIVRKHDYHLGVATATDAGLMVPVVRNVDEKGLLELASEVNEVTERARDRSVTPEELSGGTFTVTNFGAVGGEYATPLVNYPETAILGLGAIEKRPWVADGDVVARPVLPLSLSIDHRVVDGAEAARFTNTVKEYLANPALFLLE